MRLRTIHCELGQAWPPSHGGPSHTVTWRDREYILGAGLSEWLSFYTDLDTGDLYCLSRNPRLGHIGLERMHIDTEPYPEATYLYEPESFPLIEGGAADHLLDLAPYTAIRRITERNEP